MTDFNSFSAGVISGSGAINSSLSSIVGSLAAVTIAIGSMVAAAKSIKEVVNTFREFDDTMVGVAKTTGMTGEELSTLRDGLMDMATQGPVSATALGEIATVAGQLGIEGSDNIMKFTEAISQMSVATGVSAEQLATDMAKISNAFSMPIDQVTNLGSAINELENTTAAATQEIVQGMTNAAASAGTLGMKAPDIAAMTATIVSMGESGLDAGTQLNRAFTEMAQNYEKAAAQMGISSEEFKRMMDEDMTQAVMMYLEYLSQIPSQTDKVTQATEVVGAVGAKAFSKLSKGIESLQTNMANANVAFEEGTSLLKEYEVAAKSFGGVMDTMANQFDTIKIAIGDALAPIFMQLAESVESNLIPALQEFANLLESMDFSGIEGSINAIITSISQLIETLNQSSAGVQSVIDVFNALAMGISAAAQTIISAIKTIVVSIDAMKKAFDAAGEAKGLRKLSAFTSTWSAEMAEGLSGIQQDWESWWQSFQTNTSDIKPVKIKITLTGQEEVDNYINFLKEYSEEGQTISSTIRIEGKEEYEQFMSQMETVPDTKATLIRSEVNDQGVEEYIIKIKSIPEVVHTSITPTIDNEESFNNFVSNFKGLEGVTANITLNTEITGENVESIAQSVAELGQTDVKVRVNFDNMETFQQFQSQLEEIGADVKVSQVRAEVSGTGDIEYISAMIEGIPDKKDIKITVNKSDVFNIDNILEGLKREVLINIGVAIAGEEDIEQVKEFIDSTPTERAFQLVCSILGEDKVEEIGNKIQELTRLPGEIVKNIMIKTMGEEKVKEIQETIDIMPQEKIAQIIVDTTGIDELTNVQDTLEVMPSDMEIKSDIKTVETNVEGLEDVKELKNAIDSIPDTKNININIEGLESVRELEDAINNIPSVKKTTIEVSTKGTSEIEPIASMKTGGGVPETGLYMLHKGEEVIPADKKYEILGSYQAGTVTAGIAAAGATAAGAATTTAITAVLSKVLAQVLKQFLNKLTSETTKNIGKNILGESTNLLSNLGSESKSEISDSSNIITSAISDVAVKMIEDLFSKMSDKLKELITLPIDILKDQISKIVDVIGELISLPITVITDGIKSMAESLTNLITLPIDIIIDSVKNVAKSITNLITLPIDAIIDGVKQIAKTIVDFVSLPFNLIIDSVKNLTKVIVDFISLPFTIITDSVKTLAKTFTELVALPFDIIMDSIKQLVKSFTDFISLPFTIISDSVKQLAKSLVEFISLPFSVIMDSVKQLAKSLVDFTALPFSVIIDSFKQLAKTVNEFITLPFSVISDSTKQLAKSFIDFIALPFDIITNGIKQMAKNISDFIMLPFTIIASNIKNIVDAFINIGNKLIGEMTQFLSLPFSTITEGMKSIANTITDFITLPFSIIIDSVKKITNTLIDLISLPLTSVINSLKKISSTITDFMLLPLTEFIRAVTKIVDAIVSIVTTPFDELIETITDIVNIFTDLVAQPIREFADQLYMFIDPIKTVSNLFDALSNPLAAISSLLNKITNFGFNNTNTNNNVVVNYNPIIQRDVDIDSVTDSLLRRISVGF